MDRLRKKLHSSRGASILLALLFLLVCMMVGASVLMAAVSNAGKLRSNREEQQKYLTLSSALTLMCGELERVEYVGKYSYHREPVYITVTDEEGNTTSVFDHYKHDYKQKTGELRVAGTAWELNETAPLYHDLDSMFADNFQVPPGQRSPLDEYRYTALNDIQPQSPHALTLAVDADRDACGALTDEVQITVRINAKGEVVLTATLKDHLEYIMEALLKPGGKPENLLVLSGQAANGSCETAPLTWTLDHVVKKEAGG